ncbi:MAG: lytic murein transglycosylase B [Rubrivivax sp.]|nr:lytic murein transglycosylase B [Rubrivivax sp.]
MCSLLLVLLPAAAVPAQKAREDAPRYAQRNDVRAFAADVAIRRGLERSWVLDQLAQARLRTASQKLMMPAPAGQAKNWAAYRDRFIEPRRILAGTEFWRDHADALARAEARWGVPAEVIVGVIGVETFYGRITGNFRVIDALATLAFDFPRGRSDRSEFFRAELEEFLVFASREGLAPTSVQGSFAGAVGWPQFMPGSINRWAVDFDGDGRIDLVNSPVDAIGSVANFLAEHGWQAGLQVLYAVTPPADAAARALLLAPDILPSFSAEQLARQGAVLADGGREHTGLLALVMVENGAGAPSYFAGTQNFYVITRYNRSSYYALAVIELGRAIQRSR